MKLNFVLAMVLIVAGAVVSPSYAQTNLSDSCDYTNSIDHFGWGWDESTRMSCAPDPDMTLANFVALYQQLDSTASYDEIIQQLRVDYCFYDNAVDHDGWGWNDVLSESCAPEEVGLPEIVAEVDFPDQEYILHLAVSSDSVLYSFEPSSSLLSATSNTGEPIWRVPVLDTFINDLQLNDTEDLLIASGVTSETFAYDLEGNNVWRVKAAHVDTFGPPDISLGDTAIIASYLSPMSETNARAFESYNYDGTVRWRYRLDSVRSATLGNDGLFYVELEGDSSETTRLVVLRQ